MSNTTKPQLQAYSQEELRQIAASIEEYRRNLQEEYAWTDHEGKVHVEPRLMQCSANEQLHVMAKELYIHGARKQNPKAELTLKKVGETICKEDPR